MKLRNTEATILVTVAAIINAILSAYSPCIKKDFGLGSVVCVCNATYCDKFVGETELGANQYVVYTSTKDGQRFNESIHTTAGVNQFEQIDLKLELNVSTHFQTIFGFGGAFTGFIAFRFMDA